MQITYKVLSFNPGGYRPEGYRFSQYCFDESIGKVIRIQGFLGLLTAAEVIEEGKAALLTFDLKGITPMEIVSIKDKDGYSIWPRPKGEGHPMTFRE